MPTTTGRTALIERLVREQFMIIETGRYELAEQNVTADYVNHRSITEPAAARGRGPSALLATAEWLRTAFSDLHFEIEEIAVIGDRAVVWATLRGTQTGPFVGFDPIDGSVGDVFPATGQAFAARQVHWFRVVDDAIAEHDAVRDDLELARQLGWIPPRPAYIVRMRLAHRRERRSASAGA